MTDPSTPGDAAAERFLLGRIDYERTHSPAYALSEFKLERMAELLDRLGNPQREVPIVHVAGTKGKGSTAAMIATALGGAGFRTGLFTSPHLLRMEERLVVDSAACSQEQLRDLVGIVRPHVEAMDAAPLAEGDPSGGPTYFEILTALALVHFAAHRVQAAVLEVGLGGRLDATNVCQPLVSVITSISFDHTRQLGDTIAAIAGEKAGIIKPATPVVCGATQDEARDVIAAIAHDRQAPMCLVGRDFTFDYRPPHEVETRDDRGRVDVWLRTGVESNGDGAPVRFENLPLALLGRHQAANAATAIAALCELRRQGWSIPDAAIAQGLAEVRWPARVEVVSRGPVVVVDSAHNVASIEALLAVLEESFRVRRKVLVFAASQDKDVQGMLERLLAAFDEVILTQYVLNPRALPAARLAQTAGQIARRMPRAPILRVEADALRAWQGAGNVAGPDDLICVTGSLFIAAEVGQIIRAPLADRPCQPLLPAV